MLFTTWEQALRPGQLPGVFPAGAHQPGAATGLEPGPRLITGNRGVDREQFRAALVAGGVKPRRGGFP